MVIIRKNQLSDVRNKIFVNIVKKQVIKPL